MSTIRVLEYFKFKPYIMKFKCCGISKINSSISIKKDSDINVNMFNSISKVNIPIVFSSPTCLQTIEKLYPFVDRKRNYNYLNNVFDIFSFLRKNVKFENIKKINKKLQYHPPCHTRESTIDEDIKFVLENFYSEIEILPKNCCGMAGSFGIFEKNIKKAKEIGKNQMKIIENNKNDLITSCGTCSIQIKNYTSVKVNHPIYYLYDYINNN